MQFLTFATGAYSLGVRWLNPEPLRMHVKWTLEMDYHEIASYYIISHYYRIVIVIIILYLIVLYYIEFHTFALYCTDALFIYLYRGCNSLRQLRFICLVRIKIGRRRWRD